MFRENEPEKLLAAHEAFPAYSMSPSGEPRGVFAELGLPGGEWTYWQRWRAACADGSSVKWTWRDQVSRIASEGAVRATPAPLCTLYISAALQNLVDLGLLTLSDPSQYSLLNPEWGCRSTVLHPWGAKHPWKWDGWSREELWTAGMLWARGVSAWIPVADAEGQASSCGGVTCRKYRVTWKWD